MRFALAALAALVLTPAAQAQVPPDIAEKTRAIGQTMNPAEGYSPWEGRFDASLFENLTITRAIKYGEDPAQALDIYKPDGSTGGTSATRPVLVFVHGGGFVGGRRSGHPYPDNIPSWAVREGMVGVSIDYRLAPGAPFPAGANDLSLALQWVRANIANYGGDPQRIVLLGHSAGGNHVADYIAHAQVHGPEFAAIKGAAVLSPNYADSMAQGAAAHVYYGSDAALQTARPVVDQLGKAGVPLFIGYAEFDPDEMQRFAQQARGWLCDSPLGCPGFVRLADHNHFTEGMALGTVDRSLAGPLAEWFRKIGAL
ncbi:alpha/beta hydrolase [Tsuneonella sp. HG222]